MDDETPSIKGPAASTDGGAASPGRRQRGLWLALALLLAFGIGVGAALWAIPHVQRWWAGDVVRPTARVPAPFVGRAAVSQPALAGPVGQLLDTRVVQLEERLNRISVEAQGASSNAARAEGLLVAFAARRALDSGMPLGYLEAQLRLRFGQAQPRAVATIINAAREPVTLVDLRAGLLDVATDLTSAPARDGWWQAVEREARALVTLRKTTTPSSRPQAALDRALRYIDAGRVPAAFAEVERMPNRIVADRWMQYARRYLEAHRALDLIETAALLEPRALPGANGGPARQTSLLAP
ncbi:hypothetical protein WG908_03990 [Sphingobium sp. AN641]|uniref:hypothetical protein n=1 Tax=Sphingobium sp. AN641 TaxID=3133443 RepID=UPI0030BB379B